jgi:hypothetical protein
MQCTLPVPKVMRGVEPSMKGDMAASNSSSSCAAGGDGGDGGVSPMDEDDDADAEDYEDGIDGGGGGADGEYLPGGGLEKARSIFQV